MASDSSLCERLGMNTGNAMRRVLLVEPSADEREMYAEWFRRQGFATLQADNSADAYRLAVELTPEVMITELRLGSGSSGLALTQRLKEDMATRGIRVVILSSAASYADEAAIQSVSDLVLRKPCLPEMLAAAVSRLMARAA